MQELLAYSTFAVHEDAMAAAEILRNGGIVAEVATRNQGLGTVLIGDGYADNYILRIAGADFERAHKLLIAARTVTMHDIDPKDPLAAMNNDELQKVVAAPDEWGADNYNIALVLLTARGVTVSAATIGKLHETRMKGLQVKKDINPYFGSS